MKRLCYELKDLAFPIRVEQRGIDWFRITYGQQIYEGDYVQACHELGEDIFHALACDGALDNK